MAENKTIKNFTAADIEKYWKKKLSPAEMHEMEKAAMDDPFLADALEGFRYSANADEELRVLRGKLDDKVNTKAPVIPIPRRKYAWLKIAASIIVLAGAGLLVQLLVLKNKNESPIAIVDRAKDSKPSETTKTAEVMLNKGVDTTSTGSGSNQSATAKTEKKEVITSDLNSSYAFTPIDSVKSDDRNETYFKKGNIALQRNDSLVLKEAEKREAIYDQATAPSLAKSIPDSTRPSFRKDAWANDSKAKQYSQGVTQFGVLNNSFNYRVVDPQNNPVPFANVLNTRDNIGTYTDVRGYFNLVSSDSILDVQVRSLGFNSERYRLIPSKQPNTLILKEDATARMQMENDQVGRVMSNASRKDSAEIEEPEVGWGNYNTYIENNIKIPENVRAKNALNEVELSFDVDKSGQPVNIKVIKSSQCKECDEEAKRLLKEGPKWKRKGRKYKTTISIAVDQK